VNRHTAEVRKLTAAELGKGFNEKQKEAEETQLRQTGAKQALEAAAKANVELLAQIKHLWKNDAHIEGFTKEEVEAMGADVQRKIVEGQIKWVQRAIGTMDAMVINCDKAIIVAVGKAQAFRDAEKAAKDIFSAEQAKLQAFDEALASGAIVQQVDGSYVHVTGEPRGGAGPVVGVHPGLTQKQRRLEEERAEREAQSAQEPSQEPPAAEHEEAGEARLRPKKSSRKKRE